MAKHKDILSQYTGVEPKDPAELESAAEPVEPGASPIRTGGLVTLDGATALMLDCRLRDGRRLAFPYSYLSRAELGAQGSIVCHYPSITVTVLGRALGPVYTSIVNHTAIAISESETQMDPGGDAPYIDVIEIAEAGDDVQA